MLVAYNRKIEGAVEIHDENGFSSNKISIRCSVYDDGNIKKQVLLKKMSWIP